jgi:hypothetical protein
MEFERVRPMLDALGPGTPLIHQVARVEDAWLLEMEDGAGIAIEWDGEKDCLVFSAPCGRPSVDRRFVVYESLLSFNLLWRETHGALLALDGPSGEVLMVHDLQADDLTALQLDEYILGFAELATQWRDYVAAEAASVALPLPQHLIGRFA